jgi:hypothetical protein
MEWPGGLDDEHPYLEGFLEDLLVYQPQQQQPEQQQPQALTEEELDEAAAVFAERAELHNAPKTSQHASGLGTSSVHRSSSSQLAGGGSRATSAAQRAPSERAPRRRRNKVSAGRGSRAMALRWAHSVARRMPSHL